MGIEYEIKGTNKTPATTKLMNQILSFLFEQQYDEMKYFTEAQKKSIEKVSRDLKRVIKKVNG